jgi:glutamate-5-semialdehyde dehydrogenase
MPEERSFTVQATGDELVIPAAEFEIARDAVARAHAAFRSMTMVTDEQISQFFRAFADRLADDRVWGAIATANETDVDTAREKGKQVHRLVAGAQMRDAMIEGLLGWSKAPSRRGEVVERRDGGDWIVERRRAPLGVVAFVFEGRPNVFADGVGVVRGGNTSVMRIGSDALRTAESIEAKAVAPALESSGLPDGAVVLVRSPSHASAHALFTLPEIRLAVARGSGPATRLLGAIATQHGIPASLHGTGGAWMYLAEDADDAAARHAIVASLDRKVCNTLNTLVLSRRRSHEQIPLVLDVLAERDRSYRLHVANGSHHDFPSDVPNIDVIPVDELSREWEWEKTPEVSLVLAKDDDDAIDLINTHSPRFVASIITADRERFERFYERVEAPYVSDGFTRWVDGQWAWDRPELGLSNWERGRIIGRSGILSGDDVYTVRDVFTEKPGSTGRVTRSS